MQKKIIALAIASAMTVPAMTYAAEASVSGQVNMSVDIQKDGMAPQGTSNNLTSNQSRLIFKGSEDLGSGNSAIWQLDNRFNADTGTSSATGTSAAIWSGNTFLGMQSNTMGTLRVGIMDSAYKSSTRNLDVFFDVAGDNRAGVGAANGGGLLTHDKRYANAMNYNSPNMGGLSVAASTAFGSENAASGDTKASLYSLAGMYSMDAIYATLAYETLKYGTVANGTLTGAAGKETKALKVGAGFKTDAFTVNAVIERPTEKAGTAAAGVSTTNFYLGGSFALGSADSVRAAFTKRGATSGATNDAKQYAIGYAHDMSKATSVYVTYVKTTDNTTVPAAAADPSALSFGMKHSF
jgi:predicted porin